MKLCVFAGLLLVLRSASCQNPIKTDSSADVLTCDACRVLTEQFVREMDEAGGGEGVRGRLCGGPEGGECHRLVDDMEEWFNHRRAEEPDLFNHLCVKRVHACCPAKHFGPDCLPCDCSGNGDCDGSGLCACDEGYAGPRCEACNERSYESYRDADKLLCSRCHVSCKGGCKKAGPEGCDQCHEGWVSVNGACRDVDECSGHAPCLPREFCVNADGSFACQACDVACDGCHGHGPDQCDRCAQGFTSQDNLCIDIETRDRQAYVGTTRYATYLGLCVATCILLQKSTMVAATVGLSVAIYIAVSEYTLLPNS